MHVCINFILWKPCNIFNYVGMCVCIYMFHKVTFDWCLSQLVVAVRLWSRNDQWRSTRKWGLEIRLCVLTSTNVRPRSKIRITFERRSENTINIVDARWCIALTWILKNARLAKVVENIFEPRTDWPGDSPRICRGVLNNMLQPTRPFTTLQKEIL